MDMEFMAEFTEGMSRDRARQVIKRKRTKRNHLRPCSPFRVSSSSIHTDVDCFIDTSSIADSSIMSSDTSFDTTTKEDEDMANCLILLAQSVSPVMSDDKSDDKFCQKTERLSSLLSSRRLLNLDTNGYECKTCNRTFPSFQALGGHRASHKKPKAKSEEKTTQMINYYVKQQQEDKQKEEEEEVGNHKEVVEDVVNKASIVITNNVQIINHNMNKAKVHECSICGSEFLSGQALGGHMRKHRPVQPSGINRTGNSATATTDDSASDQIVEGSPHKNSGLLSLDLNFPPPEVVETYQFSSSQQHMLFPSPAFVDCHY